MPDIVKEFDPIRDRAPLRLNTREGKALRGIDDGPAAWLRYCQEQGQDASDDVVYCQWMAARETPVDWR